MMVRCIVSVLLLVICNYSYEVAAFITHPSSRASHISTKTKLYATKQKTWTKREKDNILNRNGEYFKLNRMNGAISFGSSSRITTTLDGADEASIRRWLSNDEQIANSIWDPKLIQNIEPKVYRLKLMKLMFVTIQLSPHVM